MLPIVHRAQLFPRRRGAPIAFVEGGERERGREGESERARGNLEDGFDDSRSLHFREGAGVGFGVWGLAIRGWVVVFRGEGVGVWGGCGPGATVSGLPSPAACGYREIFFSYNTLVRIHFIIVMIKWTGLAPWEFDFPFPGSLTSTFLARWLQRHGRCLVIRQDNPKGFGFRG